MTESTILFHYLREIKAFPSLLLTPVLQGMFLDTSQKTGVDCRHYVHTWVVTRISRPGSEAKWTLTLGKSILSVSFATKQEEIMRALDQNTDKN